MSAGITKLLFVRHGESKANEGNLFAGTTDVPLSGRGMRQAEELKTCLLSRYKIDAIYASDLQRACDTVRPTAEALRLPIHQEKALREIDGGCWEGKSVEYISRVYRRDYEVWRENIGLARCTGGESMEEVQKRGIAAVGRIAAENEGRTVLIATHAGFLRAMQCFWEHRPLGEMKNIPWIPNASLTEADWQSGLYRIVVLADVSFLQGDVTRLSAEI